MQQLTAYPSRWLYTTAAGSGRVQSLSRHALNFTHHIHNIRHEQRRGVTSDDGVRKPSLFEELFPVESASATVKTPAKPTREVPRLNLNDSLSATASQPKHGDDFASPPTVRRILPNKGSATALSRRRSRLARPELTAILVLRNAGRHLLPEDFKRLSPRTKHIEGWINRGEIVNVIRGRNHTTLAPDGTYILVFENAAAARACKDHYEALHKRAGTYAPMYDAKLNLLTTPLPPPPSAATDSTGRATSDPVEYYALVPPQNQLHLHLWNHPLVPEYRFLVENSGYPALTQGRISDYEVLASLAVPSGLVSVNALKRAIARDGQDRGMKWSIKGERNNQGVRAMPTAAAGSRDTGSEVDTSESGAASEATPRRTPGGFRRWNASGKFIVSFPSEAEARRFVMVWHRRDIADLLDERPSEDESVILNAEYIW